MTVAGKLWRMLTVQQRWRASGVACLILISVCLETLSIALVLPALSLMTESGPSPRYAAALSWFGPARTWSRESLIMAGVVALFGIYLVKAAFLAFLAWRQARFVYQLQANFSQRLFAGYLRQPYVFHLQRNSAQLIRNTGQASDITFIIKEGLTLAAELLVVLGISVLLLTVEPSGALFVAAALGVVAVGFSRLTRAHLLRWGEAQHHHEGLRIQKLQEGLGGVKDVKLLGREVEFLSQYRAHSSVAAFASERAATVVALPRLVLEVLAVGGVTGVVLVMLGQGKPLQALVPTLGLFVAVAFRVMPSTTRVLAALQNVRFCVPVINTLFTELQLLEGTPPPGTRVPLPLERALTLDRVSYQYPGAATAALIDITLTIPRGASVGFIGGSGAGKTTLVDVILGLLAPVSGRVEVDGVDIQQNLRGWQDQIGYVPQAIFLTDDTIRRNVALGVADEDIDDAGVWRAIRAAQLDDFIAGLPNGLQTVVGERGTRLSGGQRQRIGVARALYHDPAVLVLDEATSSLDVGTEREVMETIRRLHGSKTILIVAHRLSTVERCDWLYRLEAARIVDQGSGAALLTRVRNPHTNV